MPLIPYGWAAYQPSPEIGSQCSQAGLPGHSFRRCATVHHRSAPTAVMVGSPFHWVPLGGSARMFCAPSLSTEDCSHRARKPHSDSLSARMRGRCRNGHAHPQRIGSRATDTESSALCAGEAPVPVRWYWHIYTVFSLLPPLDSVWWRHLGFDVQRREQLFGLPIRLA